MVEERNKRLQEVKRFNNKMYAALTKERKRRIRPEEYETEMRDPDNVLEIDNLCTCFYTDVGTVRAVDGVTIDIKRGKTTGIVGESGCGKSVMSLSILRLLQEPQGQISGGAIRFNTGKDKEALNLVRLPPSKMDSIRGAGITMIFQEPMTTLNPVFTAGKQLDEVLLHHNTEKLSKKEIAARSIETLKLVGIANAEGVYRMYPHELSGGMRQRVVIAMSLMCNPRLIIADEPTTALDVTIQAQILDLMRELKNKISASIMLITHDLGVIAETADYVVVMYAGRVVEQGEAGEIFNNPRHPYTIGLMKSRPSNESEGRLYSIPGNVPNPIELPDYCFFRSRCEVSVKACAGKYPPVVSFSNFHKAACWRCACEAGWWWGGGGRRPGRRRRRKMSDFPSLEVRGLKKYFPIKKGITQRIAGYVKAVDGVSFSIKKGETFGLVGESGCGKTTVGRTALRLTEPSGGNSFIEGRDIFTFAPRRIA